MSRFKKYKSSRTGGNYISLGVRTISFFPTFMKENKLLDMKSVDIFYDKDENEIAFKFYNDKDGGAIKIREVNGTFYINSNGFYKVNNLKGKEIKGRFEPIIIEDSEFGELFSIKLNKE